MKPNILYEHCRSALYDKRECVLLPCRTSFQMKKSFIWQISYEFSYEFQISYEFSYEKKFHMNFQIWYKNFKTLKFHMNFHMKKNPPNLCANDKHSAHWCATDWCGQSATARKQPFTDRSATRYFTPSFSSSAITQSVIQGTPDDKHSTQRKQRHDRSPLNLIHACAVVEIWQQNIAK